MPESFRPPSPREFAAGTPTIPPGDTPPGAAALPGTGDPAADTVLTDLAAVESTDLDGILAAGERVHVTLTSRLADLGP